MMTHQKSPMKWLRSMMNLVGAGSGTPNPTNMLAKIGTTNLRSAPTTSTAMVITETG